MMTNTPAAARPVLIVPYVWIGDFVRCHSVVRLLDAQDPESFRRGEPAHDEMLFIVIHQAYELWFKQLLFETDSVIHIMRQPSLNDNSPELQTVVHRLARCGTILKVLVHQIDIMETMTPMDFLDFRDMLRPASGFQSWQFKLLEARLGLKFGHRYGKEYYISQLRQPEVDVIKTADHIIDMGPEGGAGGGSVIAEGTPEAVAKIPESFTGRYLKLMFAGKV